MKWLRKTRFKLGVLFSKNRFNAEMEAEMRMHLELRTEKNIAAGMPPEEAHYAALRSFGGLDQLKERARDQRGGVWLGHLIQDVRYGWRMLRKSPLFTAVAVLSLALGIGASTAIFSLVNAILLGSLPVPNPQELRVIRWYGGDAVNISGTGASNHDGPGGQLTRDWFSYPVFRDLRKQLEVQADIFAYSPIYGGVTARTHHEAVATEGLLVSDNFFSGLGARPLLGYLIGAGNNRASSLAAVVISYRWWEQQFDLDPNVLGQPIVLNGHGFIVVGVLPRGFRGVYPDGDTELYVPLSAQPQVMPGWSMAANDWWVKLMARLRPGVSNAQLQATLDATLRGEKEIFPKESPKVLISDGRDGIDYYRSDYQKDLMLLLCVVGVVLLVACANLAGLLLARGATRQHEFSVRIALGAGHWRLIRQLLTESILLSLLGGGIGIVLGLWGKIFISRLLAGSPAGLNYDTALDLKVLGFTVAVSLVTALLSGLLPALKAGRIDPLLGLKDRMALGAGSRLRVGQFIVIAQVALSLVLVVGGGLYVRTLINLVRVNPGFALENLLLFQLNPHNSGYSEPRRIAYYENVQHSLAAVPGVRSAALIEFPLLGNNATTWSFTLPDHPSKRKSDLVAWKCAISETFFATMGIPMLLGRDLTALDTSATPKVAVVNEAFARTYLPGEIPIGQTIKTHDVTWQIVGVCRDAKYDNIKKEVPPTMYLSFRQRPAISAFFVSRTALPPLAVATAARKAVAAIDPNIPLTDLSTQEQIRDQTIISERTFATLCSSLALLAVLLSSIGLYGLMAYDVACRTGEMGIRKALGATHRQIAVPILRRSLTLAGAGVAVGVPLALGLTRIVHANLYGLKSSDPATLCGAVLLLLAVALIAAWIPARRAARVDPMVALRCE